MREPRRPRPDQKVSGPQFGQGRKPRRPYRIKTFLGSRHGVAERAKETRTRPKEPCVPGKVSDQGLTAPSTTVASSRTALAVRKRESVIDQVPLEDARGAKLQ